MRLLLVLITLALLPSIQLAAAEGDWAWWRGPNFNGVADDQGALPTSWSATKNVVWKTTVPGRGHSSPIVVGDRVFLATADESAQKQAVVAFDRASGEQLWLRVVSEGGFPKIHRKNTHASATVAWDGERLIAAFANHDRVQVVALGQDGMPLWSEVVGVFEPKQYQYGYAPSPLIYKDTVIVAADYDRGGYIVALDRKSGKQAWKTPRPARLSYSSPVVANVGGRDQLLISGCDRVASYNPADGKQLWSVSATTMATCGTMVWDGDLVFASGGYPDRETVCVKADGSEIVWRNKTKCYEQSMLAHDGFIYAFDDNGVAYCWKAADGTEMWKQRLAGPVSASPILAGGNIYASNESGTTYVFKASPDKFELVATNKLGNSAFATPAICGERIYLRVADSVRGKRTETLYCLGLE